MITRSKYLCLVLAGTEEIVFLLLGLEATMTELGGSIDELQVDLLGGNALGLREQSLTQSDDTLLGTNDAALQHDVVLVHFTVVGKSTEGSDVLVGQVSSGAGVVHNLSILSLGGIVLLVSAGSADAVDFLVDLGTVMVTVLTGTRNRVLYASRVPGTNTGDLTETSVSLTWQTSGTPSGGDTFKTVTFAYTNSIDHIVLGEDSVNADLLLEEAKTPVDLLGNGTTINLNFHDVGFLLTQTQLANLGVSQDANNLAVFLHALKFGQHILVVLLEVGGVAGEGFLLAAVPVLVESSAYFLAQMFGPNSSESSQTTGSFDVTNKTNNHHRWGLDDSDGFNGFLLVERGSWTIDFTENVSHTGLYPIKAVR